MPFEGIYIVAVIGGLFCLLDMAINREVERSAIELDQISCPSCGKPVPGADLLTACRGCGRYVCPCCRIHDVETLCQDCYISTRAGGRNAG